MSQNPAHHLGIGGALASRIEGFAPRPGQQEMASAIAAAIAEGRVFLCEAGTGTGKTYAYLVPALLSGKRVLISTGTKNLQEQLFYRDLPLVREALGLSTRVALLKGRGNYLCLHRLERTLEGLSQLPKGLGGAARRVQEWARHTRSGDQAELGELPEHHGIWRLVTSGAETCLGQRCAHFNECHALKARRDALAADLIVVNHHLLLADMALKDEGFGEVLPRVDSIIIDEAHQLPELASQFFGMSVGSRQLTELARDSLSAYAAEAGDVPDFPERSSSLESRADDLLKVLGGKPPREAWEAVAADPGVADAFAGLLAAVEAMGKALASMAERGLELSNCHRRCENLESRLRLMAGPEDSEQLRWVETRAGSFTLRRTPLDVAPALTECVQRGDVAWVFTSATLAVGRSFTHFASRLGLVDWQEGLWESPFDFRRQALCYIPSGLPSPGERGYVAAVVEAALPVLEASAGRAFVLFTSHRALREATPLLRAQLDYPLLVQGEAARGELLERFREETHSVLLGTSSFWEGVDVRGEALSCVVIDKLPFASPDDPVLRARYAAVEAAGGSPFREYMLPQAVIALKQGAGRLIRDVRDRGVLMLCDPRLYGRGYGRTFLASLPPMPRTRELDAVRRFFSATPAGIES